MKPVLEGTVALVTGASSGIGAATAAALAAQGAAVALAARRKDRLDALAAGIRDQGGTALVLESDITDETQATDAVERTVAELGRLDTLINNAGVMLLGPAVGAPLSEWQRMVELNVLGLLYCAHAALPHLLARGRGRPAPGGRHGEHQLGRGPGGAQRQRRLQPDQARRRRVQRVAAPGGHQAPRARLAGRAGRDRDRAGRPQPARGAREHPDPVRA